MRVGLIVYGIDRPLTGIGRYTVELVQSLATWHDESVEFLLLTAGGAGPLAETGLKQIRLPGCRLLPALMTLGSSMIPLLARRHRLDIVHDTTGASPLLFGAGSAGTIATVHDVIPLSMPGFNTHLDTLIYRRWLPRVLPRLDAVITVSEASKNDIAQHLRVPPRRIHNASEGVTNIYRPADASHLEQVRAHYELPQRYILYVGSIEARKNLSRVLEAFASLKQSGVSHDLVIVGPQKWKYGAILETLQRLKLENSVLFTGYVPETDLPIIYSGADVFVFPSLYEGFGLPVLEAMACGTAVVTSNTSSLPEVIGDAGLQVDPYSVDEIASAILRLLGDAALRHRLQQKAIERAAGFTWERTAETTIDIYRQVMHQPPSASR
ncbi:MAG: glycosyltransferase family 4 protein [Chloroflexi bacterium]|nr:glycosyltransferase family 4 protein [Chloroflexota bacterium]